MAKDVLIKILMDKPVSYHADFSKALGSVTAGLFLCQTIYWTGKGSEDEWFYKTRDDWKNELGMSRKEQETARKKLRDEGVLQEQLRGLPARLHYRIDFDRLIEIMKVFYKIPETPEKSSWPESDQLDGTKVANRMDRKSLTYNTENTTGVVVGEGRPDKKAGLEETAEAETGPEPDYTIREIQEVARSNCSADLPAAYVAGLLEDYSAEYIKDKIKLIGTGAGQIRNLPGLLLSALRKDYGNIPCQPVFKERGPNNNNRTSWTGAKKGQKRCPPDQGDEQSERKKELIKKLYLS